MGAAQSVAIHTGKLSLHLVNICSTEAIYKYELNRVILVVACPWRIVAVSVF